ncbi:hypothetical protein AU210_012667 [Fusarium oxysporum f. sp. radicis-cucumerinum]|uniref:Fungal N-terminal domain-containing protein n=1 Tax=Fusarium oxysporum f. sp. radicis-cucumerinum TaxID=327505 RepID=A0A2H3G6C5_FUSOX|nr:hypothetical protein AU210_012667 [Fusarium oxysporum f. sp. radicis-cucumerinum]
MDPGTVLAVVSLVLQVITLADQVIESFERLKNAPQELRDFRQSAVRLQRHLEALQNDVSYYSLANILHEDDVHEIEETLTLCKELLQQQVTSSKGLVVTTVIRGVWTFRNNQKLVKYKTRIDAHYTQILVPCWLSSLSGRNNPNRSLILCEEEDTTVITETGNNTLIDSAQNVSPSQYQVAPEHIQQITKKLDKLKTADDKEATEQTLRSIDYELRTCWTELGLVEEDVDDPIDYPMPSIKRRSTLSYEDAPTTLELESAPQQHRRLRLRRLHIMARDDESRILQYQNDDLPYGSIPWTRNKSSKRVSFLKKHLVTVVDSEGYHIYRLDPKYKFDDREACDRFQSTLREREVCGAFEAVEIKVDGRIVARRQMLRFWRRVERNGTTTNTITYYISSGTSAGEHDEINLAELQSSVTVPRIRRLSWDIGRRVESNSVDLMPSLRGSRQFHIKFETDEEAKQFKERFSVMQNGGFSQPPSLIGDCSTRAESTLAGTPVMGPKPDLTAVPIIAFDTGAQEGLFEEWNTAVFQAGNYKS